MLAWRVWLLTGTLLGIGGMAHAQPQAPAGPAFVAADFFGGFSGFDISGEDAESAGYDGQGWLLGSTLRFQRWWGPKGEVARTERVGSHHWQYLGGIEVNTPGTRVNRPVWVHKGFAHALAGYMKERAADGRTEGSPELVFGGGLDLLYFFRIQLDYVRVSFPNRPKNGLRYFLGGVVPLCFVGCQADWLDGIPLKQ